MCVYVCVCVCLCVFVCVVKFEKERVKETKKSFEIYIYTQCLLVSDLCGPLSALSTVMCALKMYLYGCVCVYVCMYVCVCV